MRLERLSGTFTSPLARSSVRTPPALLSESHMGAVSALHHVLYCYQPTPEHSRDHPADVLPDHLMDQLPDQIPAM